MLKLEGIDHVALAVADVERSAAWFIDVLGFERRFEGMWNGVPGFVGKGDTAIALFPRHDSHALAKGEQPQHQSIDMLHLAFRADRKNFLAAQAELQSRGVRFDFEDHGVSHSIYFRSPDGHKFEITTYDLNQD
jgi:catechol 2,3-dioxygenase-like lactoylglutathione lyase family enzyme